jgi:hypothetical protein
MGDFNWGAISAICSLVTLIGVVGVGGVMWGTLTERVNNIGARVDVHRKELDAHEGRLNSADVIIGKVEEWKDGYSRGVIDAAASAAAIAAVSAARAHERPGT